MKDIGLRVLHIHKDCLLELMEFLSPRKRLTNLGSDITDLSRFGNCRINQNILSHDHAWMFLLYAHTIWNYYCMKMLSFSRPTWVNSKYGENVQIIMLIVPEGIFVFISQHQKHYTTI